MCQIKNDRLNQADGNVQDGRKADTGRGWGWRGEGGGGVRRAMPFSSVIGDEGLHEIEATGEERSS